MIADATIYAAAQWLSDHSRTAMLVLAALAFALEYRGQKSQPPSALKKSSDWLPSWRTNLLLFAATFAFFTLITPWIEPVLSELLSGRAGPLSLAEWPLLARITFGVLLLDLADYALHRASHFLGWWWRLHQVHHSDIAYNASTHFRQHPLAVLLALALQATLLWSLGIPLVSWVVFAALSNALQLWQHAAISTPLWLERAVSPVLVTPALHRLHHHPQAAINNSNFGTVFSLWDRVFGSLHRPAKVRTATPAPVGLDNWSNPQAASILSCMLAPFTIAATATARPTKTKPRPQRSRKTS